MMPNTVNCAPKFQDHERFFGAERHGLSGIGHDVDFHSVEILLLQRDVQDRIENRVHVSVFRQRLVDYAQEWYLRVSDDDVFHQIAIDVHGENIVQVQRNDARCSRVAET